MWITPCERSVTRGYQHISHTEFLEFVHLTGVCTFGSPRRGESFCSAGRKPHSGDHPALRVKKNSAPRRGASFCGRFITSNKYWTIWVSNTKNDTYWNDLVILWPHPSGVRDFFSRATPGGSRIAALTRRYKASRPSGASQMYKLQRTP